VAACSLIFQSLVSLVEAMPETPEEAAATAEKTTPGQEDGKT